MDLAAVDCIGRYLCLAAFAPPGFFHQAEAYLNGKAVFWSCAGNFGGHAVRGTETHCLVIGRSQSLELALVIEHSPSEYSQNEYRQGRLCQFW